MTYSKYGIRFSQTSIIIKCRKSKQVKSTFRSAFITNTYNTAAISCCLLRPHTLMATQSRLVSIAVQQAKFCLRQECCGDQQNDLQNPLP